MVKMNRSVAFLTGFHGIQHRNRVSSRKMKLTVAGLWCLEGFGNGELERLGADVLRARL